MKLAHRIAYYLGGFSIGIVILLFFLGGKRASCDYGPNARTLKNIRLKERTISDAAIRTLRNHSIDTAVVSVLLQEGNVLFSESNTTLDSCKQYTIEGTVNSKELKIFVENCEKKATVLSAEVQEEP
ncbi:hypothetical protein [Altibacter sp.]|uniref:hypothetical protein n=1 Tax=Altibacter sp. TaxID=2024823 RepID=UPI000C98B34E|nr:hypothetical protein [Altibacter sp.]MAP54859.1 hypothetical protein [Altibacter sp.]|tara:strand:+ start:54 stop:434 length:381 start_codon:yes stop_codon:yes gene_type:complete